MTEKNKSDIHVKTGLVMEGGAMRGMFTAGVTDVMMENGIEPDGAIGVSAGACFGCNYKSRQPGRAVRYNERFCKDPRYCGWRSFFKTGNIFGADFCYYEIPKKLDPFDFETFKNDPMEFYVVATDVLTGKAVYRKCDDASDNTMEWVRASSAMPLVSKIVEIDGYKLLDGGIADSIPLKYFESIGYLKNVVILTQPKGYIKEKNNLLPIMRIVLRKYPEFLEAVANRHNIYNEETAYVESAEKENRAFVIRPPERLPVGHIEHDKSVLREVYNIGRNTAEKDLPRLKEFLKLG